MYGRITRTSVLDPRPPIRLELIDNVELAFCGVAVSMTTTKDELYMHCSFRDEFINRNALREVKHVIETREKRLHPRAIVACDLSNCVYNVKSQGKTHAYQLRSQDHENR